MTYTPGIPVGPTLISNTFQLIATNFTQLNSIFDKDHVTWNNATIAERGWHRQVTFNDYNVPLAPTDPQSILYTDAVGGHPALFYATSQGFFGIGNSFASFAPTVTVSNTVGLIDASTTWKSQIFNINLVFGTLQGTVTGFTGAPRLVTLTLPTPCVVKGVILLGGSATNVIFGPGTTVQIGQSLSILLYNNPFAIMYS